MPIFDEYEILDTRGFAWEQIGIRAARLRADFGDGYGAAARLGSSEGVRAWRLRIDALPDRPQYLAGLQQVETRARYLWNFWKRCKLERSFEEFLLADPFPQDPNLPWVFARFQEDELPFEFRDCLTVFQLSGLTITQARIRGLDPNDFNPQMI